MLLLASFNWNRIVGRSRLAVGPLYQYESFLIKALLTTPLTDDESNSRLHALSLVCIRINCYSWKKVSYSGRSRHWFLQLLSFRDLVDRLFIHRVWMVQTLPIRIRVHEEPPGWFKNNHKKMAVCKRNCWGEQREETFYYSALWFNLVDMPSSELHDETTWKRKSVYFESWRCASSLDSKLNFKGNFPRTLNTDVLVGRFAAVPILRTVWKLLPHRSFSCFKCLSQTWIERPSVATHM